MHTAAFLNGYRTKEAYFARPAPGTGFLPPDSKAADTAGGSTPPVTPATHGPKLWEQMKSTVGAGLQWAGGQLEEGARNKLLQSPQGGFVKDLTSPGGLRAAGAQIGAGAGEGAVSGAPITQGGPVTGGIVTGMQNSPPGSLPNMLSTPEGRQKALGEAGGALAGGAGKTLAPWAAGFAGLNLLGQLGGGMVARGGQQAPAPAAAPQYPPWMQQQNFWGPGRLQPNAPQQQPGADYSGLANSAMAALQNQMQKNHAQDEEAPPDPTAPVAGTWAGNAYRKYVSNVPAVESAALGTAGAATGYYGGGFLMNRILDLAYSGMPAAEKAKSIQELTEDGTLQKARLAMGGMGLAAGLAYPAVKSMDWHNGIGGAAASMFTPGYWEKHPELQRAQTLSRMKAMERPYRTNPAAYDSGRSQPLPVFKTASVGFDDTFVQHTIPVQHSMDLIAQDPILTDPAKGVTNMLISNASDGRDTGLLSGKDLARSAIQAGVGYGTAYLFARALGGLLSLPPEASSHLSRIGGIAGAVLNTGILEDLL